METKGDEKEKTKKEIRSCMIVERISFYSFREKGFHQWEAPFAFSSWQ